MTIKEVTIQKITEEANSIKDFNTVRIDIFTGLQHIISFPCRAFFCENKEVFAGICRGCIAVYFLNKWSGCYKLKARLKACGYYRTRNKFTIVDNLSQDLIINYGKLKPVLPTPIPKQFKAYKIKPRNKRRRPERIHASV